MTEIPIKEQLRYLKGMTEKLNVVHEAQFVQLRNYPILIPNISSAETKVDIDKHIVIYNCNSGSKVFRKTKKVKIAIENIITWIQTVVWNDTTVEIIVNGKSIYDTRIDERQSTGSD